MPKLTPYTARPLLNVLVMRAYRQAMNVARAMGRVTYINAAQTSLDSLQQMRAKLQAVQMDANALAGNAGDLLAQCNNAIDNYRPQVYNDDQEDQS